MLVRRINGLDTLFAEVGNKEIKKIIFYTENKEISIGGNSNCQIESIEADRKIKEPKVRIGNYVFDNTLYIKAMDIEVIKKESLAYTNDYQKYYVISTTITLEKPFINYLSQEQNKITHVQLKAERTEKGNRLKDFAEKFEISEYKATQIIEAYNLF